jgi:hypothetical protein
MRKKMDCQFSLNLLSFRKSSHTHLLAALLLSLTVTLSLAANREVYAGSGKSFFLTQLNQPLDREWTHHKLVMETRYVLVSEDGKSAIQAVGQQSKLKKRKIWPSGCFSFFLAPGYPGRQGP